MQRKRPKRNTESDIIFCTIIAVYSLIKTIIMKTMKLLFISTAVLLLSATVVAQPKPWVVPANAKSVKNPVAKGEASNKAGLALYTKNCASCHGKAGLGDGVKARALKTFPGDFSKAEYQDQTDADHFFKTKTGRGEMPKYEGKMSDADIWNVVNYMRTFKK
jgi:mono/diheme cytochrome c family protein